CPRHPRAGRWGTPRAARAPAARWRPAGTARRPPARWSPRMAH
ncbi:MAG: hypothetical protein AVDCRST_MAG49-4539, partial [uncultured Thermomicrobiales bacterium]